MVLSTQFREASLEELKRGYREDAQAGEYQCLFCGRRYTQGHIYPFEGGVLMDAQTAVGAHLQREHGSVFECLLGLDRKDTGLTELQRELLGRFYRGEDDEAIAAALGIGSRSTVRNHRFSLREREKEARVFLAIMELLKERRPGGKGPAGGRSAPHGRDAKGALAAFPRREKARREMVDAAADRFEAGREYGESEVNRILEGVCLDYGTLRRELVDRGMLEREPDGSQYRLKRPIAREEAAMEMPEKVVRKMEKKELKTLYKSTPRPMGVYQIRNTANGKVLVGSSLNLDGRQNRFGFEVKTGNIGNNAELKREWDAFGAENFVFEVLDQLKPVEDPNHDYRDELAELEKLWLEQLQPYGERGYNRPPRE